MTIVALGFIRMRITHDLLLTIPAFAGTSLLLIIVSASARMTTSFLSVLLRIRSEPAEGTASALNQDPVPPEDSGHLSRW